ncbi:hypothetical protein TrVE_jg11953 [Triparma verrucosa]|uniref:Uncharacterized protein n=1 Tax=Triparma verrucosa TaxID=1606542 RepID=A0A9W7BYC0_9STRA|nr:hypothetical protein TrVE_jg11953 [Triparma verrucosa]
MWTDTTFEELFPYVVEGLFLLASTLAGLPMLRSLFIQLITAFGQRDAPGQQVAEGEDGLEMAETSKRRDGNFTAGNPMHLRDNEHEGGVQHPTFIPPSILPHSVLPPNTLPPTAPHSVLPPNPLPPTAPPNVPKITGGLDRIELAKEKSEKHFSKAVEDGARGNLELMQERAIARGLGGNARTANQDAFTRLLSGGGAGGIFETVSIAISFLQNFSLTIKIDVSFPESLKALFAWLEIFSFDFDIFGREQLGIWFSIFIGLLFPPWLIFTFDSGLRTKFGPPASFTEDGDIDEEKARRWFARCRNLSLLFIGLSIASTGFNWFGSDALDALLLVISLLASLTVGYQSYLYRMIIICDNAEEDFGKRRQESDMFFFVFSYPVAFLSGVTACTSLMIVDHVVIGYLLLLFYVFFPNFYLARYGKSVKESLGEDDGLSYQESRDKVLRDAKEDVLNDVKTGEERKNRELSNDANGFKAAVICGFVGSFEERFWWWKCYIMLERAALAVLIHINASPRGIARVAGAGFFLSLLCRPYWSMAEDWLDITVRMSNLMTCVAALLISEGVLTGDETWLAVSLCVLGCITVFALIFFIGPKRLLRGAIKSFKARKRANTLRKLLIEKINDDDIKQMTEEEFSQFSQRIKHQLAVKFPNSEVTKAYLENLREESQKFTTEGLKRAAKDWVDHETAELVYGHISEWDVSEVDDMVELFKDAKDFNGDIRKWDLSKVKRMSGMFWGAESFDQDISSWNVSAVEEIDNLFRGATTFNQDISKFDVSKVKVLRDVFSGATNFNRDFVKAWPDRIESGEKRIIRLSLAKIECVGSLEDHSGEVMKAVFSPDGRFVCSASGDKSAKFWNTETNQCVATCEGHMARVNSVAYSPDGTMICTSSQDRTCKVWRVEGATSCVATLSGHSDSCRSATFSPDGTLICTGSSDKNAMIWDVESKECLGILKGHSGHINALAFSPTSGSTICTASADNTIKLWDLESMTCVATLDGHSHWVRSVAFSPNGALLVSASRDKTAMLWSVDSKECIGVLEGHTNWVQHADFSPDGRIVCTASDDKSLKLWDVDTKQCVGTVDGHSSYANSAAFSPEGTMLCSTSNDQKIKLWHISNGDIAGIAHKAEDAPISNLCKDPIAVHQVVDISGLGALLGILHVLVIFSGVLPKRHVSKHGVNISKIIAIDLYLEEVLGWTVAGVCGLFLLGFYGVEGGFYDRREQVVFGTAMILGSIALLLNAMFQLFVITKEIKLDGIAGIVDNAEHGFRKEEGDAPPVTEFSSYWVAFGVLATIFHTAITLIDAFSHEPLYDILSRATVPIVLILYVFSVFAQPRRNNRGTRWFLYGHFFFWAWIGEGAYIISELQLGDRWTAAMHAVRLICENGFFVIALRFRKRLANLPDKDLDDFLVETLFKGGLKATVLVQFMLSRSVKCILESGLSRCSQNTSCASAISVFIVLVWIPTLIRASVRKAWQKELAVSKASIAKMNVSRIKIVEGMMLAVMAGCGALLFALMNTAANETTVLVVSAVGFFAGIVYVWLETYIVHKERRNRSSMVHLELPVTTRTVEIVECCSYWYVAIFYLGTLPYVVLLVYNAATLEFWAFKLSTIFVPIAWLSVVIGIFLRPKDNGVGLKALHLQFFLFAGVSELSKAYENLVNGFIIASLFAIVRVIFWGVAYKKLGLKLRKKAAMRKPEELSTFLCETVLVGGGGMMTWGMLAYFNTVTITCLSTFGLDPENRVCDNTAYASSSLSVYLVVVCTVRLVSRAISSGDRMGRTFENLATLELRRREKVQVILLMITLLVSLFLFSNLGVHGEASELVRYAGSLGGVAIALTAVIEFYDKAKIREGGDSED